jgi:Cd2+/Zn2+-exporting ATPase
LNNDLRRLPFLIRLSQRTSKVIHQNLIFGVIMIVVFEICGGLGYISPITGAVLHMLAATFVIFNSARLVRFGEDMHRVSPVASAPVEARLQAVPVR